VNILDQIVRDKRIEIAKRMDETSLESIKKSALATSMPPAFASALTSVPMGLIAEVKHRSPSAGVIRDPFEPTEIAKAYEAAGAQALSVLMDIPYFGGGEHHFSEVRKAVSLPMLYKEFVIDPWQIWHARALGASAVLLIASVLSDEEIRIFTEIAQQAGLEVLLEVHDAEELSRALSSGIQLMGINNRNLKTFETKLEHTLELLSQVPDTVTLISESGIRTNDDIRVLHKAGVSGVLVGEHLLRKPDLEVAVKDLMKGFGV
jgi:indole-3-glycerol phosphate synthase